MLYIGQTVGWGPPSAMCVCPRGFIFIITGVLDMSNRAVAMLNRYQWTMSADQVSHRHIAGSAYLPPCSRSNFAADVQCKVEPVQDGKTSMLVF